MRRILVAFSLAVATLLVGSIGSTSATDYSVTLTCSDGSQFVATLDQAGAAELADAVAAINAYPAGVPPVTCALLQTPLNGGGAQAAGPSHDFAVGGGQWKIDSSTANCEFTNFNLTAHVDTQTGEVRGHFSLRYNQGQMPGCANPPSGDLTAKVICLTVISDQEAHMEVVVERSSGSFPPPNTHLFVRADEGPGSSPDRLLLNSGASCTFAGPPGNEIERGNINIRVADSDFEGFSDRVEYSAGTDPWARCPSGPTHNAWPADLNNDGFSDIFDVSAMTASFGLSVPPAPARHDVAPDPPDGYVDIFDISRVTGLFGQRC